MYSVVPEAVSFMQLLRGEDTAITSEVHALSLYVAIIKWPSNGVVDSSILLLGVFSVDGESPNADWLKADRPSALQDNFWRRLEPIDVGTRDATKVLINRKTGSRLLCIPMWSITDFWFNTVLGRIERWNLSVERWATVQNGFKNYWWSDASEASCFLCFLCALCLLLPTLCSVFCGTYRTTYNIQHTDINTVFHIPYVCVFCIRDFHRCIVIVDCGDV